MKIFVQWAKATRRAYRQMDSADWPSLPRKAEPKATRTPVFDEAGRVVDFSGGKETLDDADGWIDGVCAMGRRCWGDHVAVEEVGDTLRVIMWNNDPGDYKSNEMTAMVWTFYPEIVDWTVPSGDGTLRNVGPREDLDWYMSPTRKAELAAAGTLPLLVGSGEFARVLPYVDFVPPPPAKTLHGIWLLQDVSDALAAVPTPGYREWFK